ncbi:MAG: DNA-binding response regulator [Geminicoccaceae bacterium]|nr:MAG: DNA-binding response regulator [Geminicoccaceae bacterium]
MPDHGKGRDETVLVVADDRKVLARLRAYLCDEGFQVDTGATANPSWHRLEARRPRAAAMPDDGEPNLDRRDEAVAGMAKSPRVGEDARQLRANPASPSTPTRRVPRPARTAGGWSLDPAAGALIGPAGRRIAVTPSEARLWQTLTAAPGVPVDRDTLSARVRGVGWQPDTRAVDVLVARLRARVEANPGRPDIIVTVRNRGYMLVPDPGADAGG